MNTMRTIAAALLTGAALLASGHAFADPRGAQTTGQEAGPATPVDVWLRRLVGKYRFDGLVQVVARGDCAPLPPDPAKQDQTSEAPPEQFCRSVKGTGDCIAIGTGPGVQCVLNVVWQDMYEIVLQKSEIDATEVDNSATGVFELPGGFAYLDPAMALFGFDPATAEATYLLVDNKGMPEGGPGRIVGNRATFKTTCVNEPTLLNAMKPEEFNDRLPDSCKRVIRFDARQDSKVVLITMDIEINDDVFTRATMTMRRDQPKEEKDAPAKPAAAPAMPGAPMNPAAPGRPAR